MKRILTVSLLAAALFLGQTALVARAGTKSSGSGRVEPNAGLFIARAEGDGPQ